MKTSLAMLITPVALSGLAGERAFARGAAYFESGAVVDLDESGEEVQARVVGGQEYDVTLWAERESLGHSCTCPVREVGDFCKHAMATGLAWIAQHDDDAAPRSITEGRHDLCDYLAGLDKDALVAMVLEQAKTDAVLRNRLAARAVRSGSKVDITALKEMVRKAFVVHGFVDYHGMRRFVGRVAPVEDLLRDLIRGGHAATAAELAGYALACRFAAYEKTDDLAGSFGELLRWISALHLAAWRAAKADSRTLAKVLFKLQLQDQWGFFRFEDYAALLVTTGLSRYRDLAGEAWRRIPALGPGTKREPGERRYAISGIMEMLARHDGDIDALIAVKSRDLSRSHAFLEIAEICAKAGRHDGTLGWAERERKAFPNELNRPLVEFLVAAYQRAKRHEDAVRLAWEQFRSHAALDLYLLLKKKSAGQPDV